MSADETEALLRRSLHDLRSEVGLIRRRAVEELVRLGDRRALDALMAAAARDVEAQVRLDASRAIERLQAVAIPIEEPGETTDRWSGRVLEAASSADAAAKPLDKTKRLRRADAPTAQAEPAPLRSSAAENARALEAARVRAPQDAVTFRRQLLAEALSGMPIAIEEKRYGFRIIVPLLDGRKQIVRVGYEQSDFESDKVIVVFSPCGRADPRFFRWALELNHGLSYGKLGVVAGPRGDEFVMSATLLEATADPAELRKAILSVAEKADRVEAKFSPEDRL
jgi:hypothetical protein